VESLKKPLQPRDDDPQASELPRVRLATSRCPFCHEDVEPTAPETVACASCLARHHPACWDEGRVCSACGASERLVREPGVATLPGDGSLADRLRAWYARNRAGAKLMLGAFALALLVGTAAYVEVFWGEATAEVPQPVLAPTLQVALGADLVEGEGATGVAVGKAFVGGALAQAGLHEGDVIQSIGGKPIRSLDDLRAALAGRTAGETILLGVAYGLGGVGSAQVLLVDPTPAVEDPAAQARLLEQLGVRALPSPQGGGVLLDEVLAGTPAGGAGCRSGDVVETVDGRAVRTPAQLELLLSSPGLHRIGVRPAFGLPKLVELMLP
jgi:hypothetical protein